MAKTPSPPSQTWCFPNRVAYVVNHSFPYCSDGYAVRTHEVARALGQAGHEVLVINRPGRPWDIEGFARGTPVAPSQIVDGVRYLFLPLDADPSQPLRARLRVAEKALVSAFEVFRPGAVVGVSNWENAEPALYAARRVRAPFFFEQRGFWEMSRAADDPTYAETPAYAKAREIEERIANAARGVFTLNAAMRAELAARGVPDARIKLIPNGVSAAGKADPSISRKGLGIGARYLLGYVGSLSSYEGRGDLLDVLHRLRAGGLDVDLLVVGSDAPKGLIASDPGNTAPDALMQAARAKGLGDHVHTTGQVPLAKVGAYYRLLDAMVMPRQRTKVTELVAPLKPYAAAAHGVPVFMPALPPLEEVARDISGTIYPEGDLDALTAMLRDTLQGAEHPARSTPLPERISWRRRVQPLSAALKAAASGRPGPQGARMDAPEAPARFDTHRLPRVALRQRTAQRPICAVGPLVRAPDGAQLSRPTRATLLSELATAPVGRFVVDWPGLQSDPGDWRGLWSIDNMRLNRQMMDACRIALDRGWTCQVVGPIARAQAPLFRTVASIFEEIRPDLSEAEAAP